MNVLAVTSEVYPLAKTGGLGDAVAGLTHALNSDGGTQVTVLLPAYAKTCEKVQSLRLIATLDDLPGGAATLWGGSIPELKLPVLLLKNDALYDRESLYVTAEGQEYPDNAIRFAALAKAAALIARGVEGLPTPHIVHAHDWHAALTPLYMRLCQVDRVKSVLTLHNLAFQGVYPREQAAAIGIPDAYCDDAGMGYWGQINFLKAGIRYADLITVVSHNYAKEILTPRFGCGLDGVLAERRRDLVSIPNGIDTEVWNPQRDPFLEGHAFSPDRLANKAICKSLLQRRFGLPEDASAIVLGMGSRLTTQKMADVAAEALPQALEAHKQLQVCILGQGEKRLEQALKSLAERYPDRCAVQIGFDEPRAHLLHAGADMLLHGSRFEPFGLTPLYAMLYGAIPIGSRVGGMADTIVDPGMGRPAAAMRSATGILFEGETPHDMARAIDRAMVLHGHHDLWRAMQRNGMRSDFSWERTAPAYVSAYQALQPNVPMDRIPERRRALFPRRSWTAGPQTAGALGANVATSPASRLPEPKLVGGEASAA